MSKKQPDHIIKQSFEQQNHAAPEGLWDMISESLDQPLAEVQVDEKIKSSFESTKAKAPEQVFANIEKQLIIDSVWLRLNRLLNIDRFWFWVRTAGAGLSVLALLYMGINWLNLKQPVPNLGVDSELANASVEDTQVENDSEQGSETEVSNKKTNKNIKSKRFVNVNEDNKLPVSKILEFAEHNPGLNTVPVEKKVPIKNKVSDEHKQTSEVDLDDASSFNWTLEKEEDSIVAASSDSKEAIDTLLASLNTKAFTGFDLDIHTPNLNAEAARSIHGSDDEAGKLKKRKKSPFYIGLIASCNQSTINNIEYRVSRISTSLIESSPAYSFSYGLMAVYAFSVKDALVSELYINNQYKQSIAGYDEGYYYQKKTQLDYSSVSLLYERRFPFMFFDKQLNLAVKTGGYFSYLKQVNEIIDEETLPVEHEFENSDYGLRFMLGQQTKVKNFVLDFGVNASYGLNNIFKGNALKPTEFDRTNTYYLGIYLSIRYRL